LKEAGVPEGIAIDYKRETYGGLEADKKELLKDISSFANTSVGHLVIGIETADEIPTKITALTGLNADKEVQRLDSIMRDGITPRVLGVRVKTVPMTGGGFVIVVRVPPSA
jgi:predicted HTH transcriptional regulator